MSMCDRDSTQIYIRALSRRKGEGSTASIYVLLGFIGAGDGHTMYFITEACLILKCLIYLVFNSIILVPVLLSYPTFTR